MVGRQRVQLTKLGRHAPALSHKSYSVVDFVLQHMADVIGADPKDIIFTSGATESNNLSIKGVARFHKEKKKHIITTQTVCVF